MKTISLAEFKEYGTVQGYDALLTPVGVLEKKASTDNYYTIAFGLYVQNHAAVAQIGSPLYVVLASGIWTGEVDDDYDSSQGILGGYTGAGLGCGGACAASAAPTAAGYCFMQTGGFSVVAWVTDGNVTAGQVLIGSSTDGIWAGVTDEVSSSATLGQTFAAGSSQVVGVATADDASTALAVYCASLRSFVNFGCNLI